MSFLIDGFCEPCAAFCFNSPGVCAQCGSALRAVTKMI